MIDSMQARVNAKFRPDRWCSKCFELILPDGEIVEKVCGSPKCSLECRDKWADRINAIFQQSFRTLPPTHTACVSATGLTSAQLSAAHSKLYRRLRARATHYAGVQEWADGRRHLHLLLRDRWLYHGLIQLLWLKSLPPGAVATAFYCEPIAHRTALAKYLVKHPDQQKPGECPPKFFRGHVISYSRGFLSAPAKVLWKRELAERRAQYRERAQQGNR
jgi:hypothetical protein